MTHVSNVYSVVINAAPETVFNYVSDLTRHPEWSGGKLKIEALTPGPVGIGSAYKSYGEVAGQQNRPNELRVTKFESPTLFEFVAKDPGFGEVVNAFKFKPQKGGTLMERTLSMHMNPLKAFAFKLFIRPLIGQPMMDKSFSALKSRLEATDASVKQNKER
ncbi:MAG TPA: SRPBCC family protein [Anaerolineales bacterium]|nr:SRPBCC family protein [Anaerolineales bacterium]